MRVEELVWCPRHEAPATIEAEWDGKASPTGKPMTYQTLQPCGCTIEKGWGQ